MPALLQDKQSKDLQAGLKKSYTTLEQAFNMYYAENGERLREGEVDVLQLKNKIFPYLNVMVDCGNYSPLERAKTCLTNYGPDDDRTDKIYTNFNNTSFVKLDFIDDVQLILNDGSMIFIDGATGRLLISIDTNGYKKRPNRFGHDLFMFQLTSDGFLRPMGHRETFYKNQDLYCSKTSTNENNGIACTNNALIQKDYFKNLPR